jgi:hypothetical protein
MGWASSGFEIGNKLDARTYPAARLKRPGPPPSGQAAGFDPTQLRGSPIRARPFAFHLREFTGRAVVASPHYAGPGLVKRLDISTQSANFGSPQGVFNLYWNNSPYTTAGGLAESARPTGNRIIEAGISDDQPAVFDQEGGIDSLGVATFGQSYLLDYYIGDSDFYLAFTLVNPGATGGVFVGTCLVYEGVLPTDFPAILG